MGFSSSISAAAMLLALLPASQARSCSYPITAADGTALKFANHVKFDFTTLTSLPSWFQISSSTIAGKGYLLGSCARSSSASNVALTSNGLQLKVPGAQLCTSLTTTSNAEIYSSANDIYYASVRTVAAFSNIPGTINAAFFYADDDDEIDLEVQTNAPTTLAYTNQPGTTDSIANPASDPVNTFHEYRMDWYQNAEGAANVTFFVDGTPVDSIDSDVPSVAGTLRWNAWTNGGSWSYGPPLLDATFRIQSIEAYYNRTGGGSCASST